MTTGGARNSLDSVPICSSSEDPVVLLNQPITGMWQRRCRSEIITLLAISLVCVFARNQFLNI